MLKSLTNIILNKFGYKIQRASDNDIRMPVELNKEERGIISDVMSNKLTMVSYERIFATVMACKYVIDKDIEGDFVECGVWRGGNAIAAAEIFKLHNSNKKVWLFDTFKGMTVPTDFDLQISNGKSAKNQYSANQKETHNQWCYASIQDVRNNFLKRQLVQNIRFIEGDVCQTLITEDLPSAISILRLDTDWYESTKIELEVLYPKLLENGCLIIDDYGHWSGAKKATDEYFKKYGNRPFFQYIDYTGRLALKTC